jgi:hypothetical protein
MEKLPAMIDMKRKPEKDYDTMCSPAMGSQYPWGLSISFGNEELEKLGLDPKDCAVGDMIHMHCLAKVTSVSCNDSESQDGPCHRVELQITHIMDKPENENDENRAAEPKMRPSQRLYK